MTSNGWFKGAVVACFALGLNGCRGEPMRPDVMEGGRDVPDRDMVVGEDVEHTDAVDVARPTDGPVDVPTDGPGAREVTIRQLQDLADPMHPAPGSRVVLRQSGMVALTGRTLIGTTRPAPGRDCRFAVWVGDGTAGDFSGIQVQELVAPPDGGNCFDARPRNIPGDVQPGSQVALIQGASYSEFCLGPMGVDRTMCRNYEQSQLFGPQMFMVTGMGAPPAPAAVSVSDVAQMPDAAPGPRTLALEGVLIRVQNVRVRAVNNTTDAGQMFTTVDLFDQSDSAMTRPLPVVISNFRNTSCVRNYFVSQNGMTLASVTGILLPDFGQWKIRIRDEGDVSGVDCTSDGGVGLDAGVDL